MTLSEPIITKLTTARPGKHTSHLPNKFAKVNAALIQSVKAKGK